MSVLKDSIGFNNDRNTFMTWKGSNLAKFDAKLRFFGIWGYFLSPQMDKRAYYEQKIIYDINLSVKITPQGPRE